MDGGLWRIHHSPTTASTNRDAAGGLDGDVFTADVQTAGRGRLDHSWLSPPGENLLMSVVVGVGGMLPEEVATLPLLAGLAVAEAVEALLGMSDGVAVQIKWPNDVLIGGRKACGILCERLGEHVIVGIGVNVNQTAFDAALGGRATSLRLAAGRRFAVEAVRDGVLGRLGASLAVWRRDGFRPLWPGIAAHDFLKGRRVSVSRIDGDENPADGICEGIGPDGALSVGGERIYAGEAHVTGFTPNS